MTYKCLLYAIEDGVATLTLNRPDRLNALGDTLSDDLHDAIVRSSADPDVRAMIITGAGRGSQNIASETEDAREGIRAFVEKRDPVFRGR